MQVAEKCGVAGVYLSVASIPASKVLYNLLLALYHRGHEGAGISACGPPVRTYKRVGRVRDIFDEGRTLERLTGHVAIGHTRYGTTGLNKPNDYLHPIRSPRGKFYLAHNGTIAPYEYQELLKKFPNCRFDTQVLTALLESSLIKTGGDWTKALELSSQELDGSYTCVALEKERLVAFREPRGFKPLNVGELPEGYAIASETIALQSINAKNIRPVRPGEVLIIDKNGMKSEQFAEPNPTPCAFEYVYFSDVASEFDGMACYDVRTNIGRILARKYPVEADVVMAIPDSGRAGADGYAKESGIPYTEGIRINREVGRIFILPSSQRDDAMRRKYLPIEKAVKGKRIILVDDSIVRGQTTRVLVNILRDAGAKEVHVRSTFPAIRYPCLHGGVAFASHEELAINKFGGVEGLRKYINADSLVYPTKEDLLEAGVNGCFACVDGVYPLKHVPEFSTVKALGYVAG
ncbi:MAG: amidophosphoribosyltransferase [Candidatus Aenigmatarchaeota archaeon]|nr:amidophosphoribosyltransferase [Candidatus Aenigmarchaeota archaeon]